MNILTSLDKLQETALPPHQAFYSSLTNKNISAQDYAHCQQVWQDNDMETLQDILIWYNNLDVEPFVQAVEKMRKFWKERSINIFKRRSFCSWPHDEVSLLFRG